MNQKMRNHQQESDRQWLQLQLYPFLRENEKYFGRKDNDPLADNKN